MFVTKEIQKEWKELWGWMLPSNSELDGVETMTVSAAAHQEFEGESCCSNFQLLRLMQSVSHEPFNPELLKEANSKKCSSDSLNWYKSFNRFIIVEGWQDENRTMVTCNSFTCPLYNYWLMWYLNFMCYSPGIYFTTKKMLKGKKLLRDNLQKQNQRNQLDRELDLN